MGYKLTRTMEKQMDGFDSRNIRRILKIRWQDTTYDYHERDDRPVPSHHHTLEKTSDLVWSTNPRETADSQSRPLTGRFRARKDDADHR